MAAKLYRRLPGAASSLASYYRLYLGPDHLLQVEFAGFSEKYRRFYYRDIQAVLVQQTPLRRSLGWLLGVPLLLCLGAWPLALAASGIDLVGVIVVVSVATATFGIPFVLNLAAGPTCTCHVRTAVQFERLQAIRRLRTARRLIEQLKPAILEAQPGLQPVSPGPAPAEPLPVAPPAEPVVLGGQGSPPG
jgi:hypothetical protein